MSNLKIRAQRANFSGNVEILLCEDRGNDLYVARGLDMSVLDPNTMTSPTMTISNQAAQELMDQLWHCGLRPSEGAGSAGSLAATERHLKDMQSLTFKLLDKAIEDR